MESDRFLFEQAGKLKHANEAVVTQPVDIFDVRTVGNTMGGKIVSETEERVFKGRIQPRQLEMMRNKVRFSIWQDFKNRI